MMKINQAQTLQVLIIDDDEITVFLHQTLLEMSGLSFKPGVASNGREALEYITTTQNNNFEYLIFLDLNMPFMSGWELLDEINAKFNSEKIYVVIVTSSIHVRDKEKSKKYNNIIHFSEKPLKIEDCHHIKFKNELSPYF